MGRQRDREKERRRDGETGNRKVIRKISSSLRLTISPSFCPSFSLSLCLAALLGAGCESSLSSGSSNSSSITVPAARTVPANADGSEQAIRFLEDRVKRDPDDFIALNKLTGYYLLRLRETGSATWLDLAAR
ncbi:MAG TPA: hypothetical protein VG324_28970, partial [Blastocatellia bacterium]|nr:hypothetical protein [Blastocatellia bacterium]